MDCESWWIMDVISPEMSVLVNLIKAMAAAGLRIECPYDVDNFIFDHAKHEQIFKAMDIAGIQSQVMKEYRENRENR